MIQMEEVVVNWVEGAEYAYQVFEHFEWKNDDELELMYLVPVLRVTKDFFDYLQNGLNELPEALFLDLQNERNPYGFIASDGNRVLAVDTLGYDIPMRKSRIEYEEEQRILRYLPYEVVREYPMKTVTNERTIFSLTDETMIGLTRAEREKKQLLMEAVYGLKEESTAKILYYYIEFNPNRYETAKTLKKEPLYHYFIQEIKEGWDEKHDHLLHIFLKQNEELQMLYEIRV